jgi:hypothetical protein
VRTLIPLLHHLTKIDIYFFSYQASVNALADILALDEWDGGPLRRAVRLVEYVAMTKGAEHLKLGSRHLNNFQGSMTEFNADIENRKTVNHLQFFLFFSASSYIVTTASCHNGHIKVKQR